MVMATSAIANLPTAQMLTSAVSCPRCGGGSGCLMFSSMCQCLLQVGIVDGEQRAFLQLRKEVRQPESDHAGRSGNVHPSQMKLLGVERPGHPEQVHETYEQNKNRDPAERLEVAFEIAREQQRKWESEMAEHHQQTDPAPAAVHAPQVIGDLFRQIA